LLDLEKNKGVLIDYYKAIEIDPQDATVCDSKGYLLFLFNYSLVFTHIGNEKNLY
jgi:hypothetical protein